jgi:hypothetical protein
MDIANAPETLALTNGADLPFSNSVEYPLLSHLALLLSLTKLPSIKAYAFNPGSQYADIIIASNTTIAQKILVLNLITTQTFG